MGLESLGLLEAKITQYLTEEKAQAGAIPKVSDSQISSLATRLLSTMMSHQGKMMIV
uniref:Uncharacterized protein n=1 Tax=Phocoena sinus TaxID=42100 RepID=A0A8C9C2C6_PHOSS